MRTLTTKSYAKINIGLWINEKHPTSEYHLIQTIFRLITRSDDLVFSKSCTFRVEMDGPETFTDNQNNLCLQAAQLLKKKTDYKEAAHIQITKRIPRQAGLGGGSSNAASTLISLNKLWETGLSRKDLAGLATKLGADVPFFVYQYSLAIAEGIGDKFSPMNDSYPLPIVTVFPNIRVSTKMAYSNHQLKLPKEKKSMPLLKDIAQGINLDSIENDFEKSLFKTFSYLKKTRDSFLKNGAYASFLSGSGGALFGIFETERDAKKCYERLSKIYPTCYTPKYFSI